MVKVTLATTLVLIVALSVALAYALTGVHLVECEVVNSAEFGLMGDDPDGEPMTICWDVLTNERVS